MYIREWETSTRLYTTEHVEVIIDGRRATGTYKWQNRPWQRYTYCEALCDALLALDVGKAVVAKVEDCSSLNEARTYLDTL